MKKSIILLIIIVLCAVVFASVYKDRIGRTYAPAEIGVVKLYEELDSLKAQNARLEERIRALEDSASKVDDLEDDLEDVIRFLNNEFSY